MNGIVTSYESSTLISHATQVASLSKLLILYGYSQACYYLHHILFLIVPAVGLTSYLNQL